ncbi:MAG: hypothetical protein SCARUB_02033 [Candidatus Scalindua rubra]|uniref:Uncharacterized protein n=1 Tax=Candidatus Scalindua rubra TaxID=1872076 RepID=A0A1E3XB01_9BACT|nr:MAG: hypothetical protein SCARUB_02033 [Candidatus Scalindua rubra]
MNLVYLRLALKADDLFATKGEENECKGFELIEIGSKRLRNCIQEVSKDDGDGLKERYERERTAWNLYYDILDRVENALREGDQFAIELQERAKKLVNNFRVVIG